jgi:cysteine desulfurase / selenocysteine lyase
MAEGQLPRANETPTSRVPTPGISMAAAKSPTAPSLPDPDTMFSGALARLANEMFIATPAPMTTSPVPQTPSISVDPHATESAPSIPASQSVPASQNVPLVPVDSSSVRPERSAQPAPNPFALSAGAQRPQSKGDPTDVTASPFDMPLRFDAIHNPDPIFGAIPLIDGAPSIPVGTEMPYWLAPAEDERLPVIEAPHQIEPIEVRKVSGGAFDPYAIKSEFPILQERVHGKRLVWLDNAATTQKPRAVIDRLTYYYEHENSNVHRAAHTLAARATDAYESARESVRRFIRAPSKSEIIFVRGATEGVNLVAQSWGRRNVKEGDEVLITWLEHHANIVPWQRLCAETGARLRVAPVDDRGQVILEEYEKLLNDKTRLVAFTQVSNALGTITPAQEMITLAHRHGALVLLDGAQSVSHMPVDMQKLDCDFFVLSGHKIFAPTGIGVVYGKSRVLEAMPPWQGGGNMIEDVTFERTTYQPPPARFEAGTGSIADAVGLGAAMDWLSRIGVENVERYEHDLLVYAMDKLAGVPGLRLIGTAPNKAGVISFVLAGQKTEEVGGILDKEGIAVRSGHHCAQPILRRFGLEATVRASLAPYNTCEDIDALADALHRLQAGQLRNSSS